jgi:hypothetical protein
MTSSLFLTGLIAGFIYFAPAKIPMRAARRPRYVWQHGCRGMASKGSFSVSARGGELAISGLELLPYELGIHSDVAKSATLE